MTLPIIPGNYFDSIPAVLVGLQMDGKWFKCETSCSFTYDVQMLPASSIESGYFEESIPGKISWSMTLNGNLSLSNEPYNDFGNVLDKVLARERVFLEMR